MMINYIITGDKEVWYQHKIACLGHKCSCSDFFLVVDHYFSRDLEARNSEVHLLEWLLLIEFITVLSADHVCVEILLCLPCWPIEEVHCSSETAFGNCATTMFRQFQGVVKINSVHVAVLLTKIQPLLEPWVPECFSERSCLLCVPNAWMGYRECHFTEPVVDCLEWGILTRNLFRIEPSWCKSIHFIVETFLSEGTTS